jgi:hypothetical protein
MRFIVQLSLAATLKLSTSLDDIVWLSPFIALSGNVGEKVRTYCSVCMHFIEKCRKSFLHRPSSFYSKAGLLLDLRERMHLCRLRCSAAG